MEIHNKDLRERMYDIYNKQIPMLNSNPAPIRYDGLIYGNGLSSASAYVPVQAGIPAYKQFGSGYIDQPAPRHFVKNDGSLKVGKALDNMQNPVYDKLDYADWVELVGRQIAASNANNVSNGQILPVDSEGNIIIQNKAAKLQKMIDAKNKSMGGCSSCHLNYEINPGTHYDNTAFKLGSALKRKKHVDNLEKILKKLIKKSGGSGEVCGEIFYDAYNNVHGNDYSYFDDLLEKKIQQQIFIPEDYRYEYY